MLGSLIITGLITLATSLGGLYNYSHGNIPDIGSSSFGSHSSFYGPGTIQQALTAPASYDILLGGFWSEQYDEYVFSSSEYWLPTEGYVSQPLFFTYNSSSNLYSLADGDYGYQALPSFFVDVRAYDPDAYMEEVAGPSFVAQLYTSPVALGKAATATAVAKLGLEFRNDSNHVVQVWLDTSSNSDDRGYYSSSSYNDGPEIGPHLAYIDSAELLTFYLMPFSTYLMEFLPDKSATYIDFIYAKSLGVSQAYEDGYDDGSYDGYDVGFDDGHTAGYDEGLDDANQPWTIMNGISVILGALLNSLMIVLSIEVFGIQLSYILGILVLLVGGIWILKLVRG